MENVINVEGLRINRWAESLSADNRQLVFPETDPMNFCYVWNSTPMSERKKLYRKYRRIVGEGGVESNCTLSDATLGQIYKLDTMLVGWAKEWFSNLPYKSKQAIKSLYCDNSSKKTVSPDIWFNNLPKAAKEQLYNNHKKEYNVQPYPNR